MSEALSGSTEQKRVTIITYEDVLINPALWPQYSKEHDELISAGKSVWMLRGPYDPSVPAESIVLDYYRGGRKQGYVTGGPDVGFWAYGPPIEDDDKNHKITTEPVELLGHAQKILFDYLDETVYVENRQ